MCPLVHIAPSAVCWEEKSVTPSTLAAPLTFSPLPWFPGSKGHKNADKSPKEQQQERKFVFTFEFQKEYCRV